jgi:glycoside/pentoside/hexuronide:cation symporter, GPH family
MQTDSSNNPYAETPNANLTEASDKVPTAAKVSFGLASYVGLFTLQLTKELITPVFVVALGLSPALVGVAMIIFRIYDASLAPIMGWISDNTRSKWGRRRPYLVLGTVLSALIMPLMWWVQPTWSSQTLFLWLVGSGMVLYTAAAIHSVPYESFLLELTSDYKERTSVFSYKAFLSSFGGLVIGWAWYFTQLPMFNDPVTGQPDTLLGARGLAIVAGVFLLLVGMLPVFFAKERFYATASKQEKVSLWGNVATAFKNRSFMILVGIATLAVTSTAMYNGIGFYTNLYWVAQGDQKLAAEITGVQSIVFLCVGLATIPVLMQVSAKLGKTKTLAISFGFCLAAMLCRWWVLRPDMPWLSLTSNVLIAIGVTGLWQLLPSMSADTVDDEELKSASRREGAIASVFSWFVRVAFTVGYGIPGIIVGFTGFMVKEGAHQAPGVVTAVRLWDILLPSGLMVASMALLLIYPLSAKRMGEIRNELELRRGKV